MCRRLSPSRAKESKEPSGRYFTSDAWGFAVPPPAVVAARGVEHSYWGWRPDEVLPSLESNRRGTPDGCARPRLPIIERSVLSGPVISRWTALSVSWLSRSDWRIMKWHIEYNPLSGFSSCSRVVSRLTQLQVTVSFCPGSWQKHPGSCVFQMPVLREQLQEYGSLALNNEWH